MMLMCEHRGRGPRRHVLVEMHRASFSKKMGRFVRPAGCFFLVQLVPCNRYSVVMILFELVVLGMVGDSGSFS